MGGLEPAPALWIRSSASSCERIPRSPGNGASCARETEGRGFGLVAARTGETRNPLSDARIVLGLLGGIGAGKSYVAKRAAELAPGTVIDADALGHEALRTFARDGRLAEAVGAEFVKNHGTPDAAPDVALLGERAFNEPALLRRLERLVHPYCHSAIKEAIVEHREGGGPPLLVLDVALLIEVGLDRQCDQLWFVDVPDALRAQRAGRRGLTLEQLQRREAFQSPRERKRARADLVIRNDVDEDELDRQILMGLAGLGIGPEAHNKGGTKGSSSTAPVERVPKQA